ncbi:hypothetical protein [Thiomicrorhabdus sp. 6S3-12]|uniref:hypothetical protein n=1 Tax=Thiomicrorhabdus sp. 6S3-12 TaxID=2819681 RepID=UPI001AAD2E56|nr:hypothetical protein [Thiomicrorhabdus sp. 6S3-12]MBO1924455.1 hypothetical protein [Thiomicrorhabdus sp. 6S3-12]
MKLKLLVGAVCLAVSSTSIAANGKPFQELQAQIDAANAEIRALKDQVSLNSTSILEIRELIKTQNANISAINAELQNQMALVEGALSAAEQATAMSESAIQELESTKLYFSEAIESINGSIQVLESELSTITASLKSSNEEFQLSIDSLKSAIEVGDGSATIGELVAELVITTAELAVNNTAINDLFSQIDSLRATVESNQALLAKVDQKIAEGIAEAVQNVGAKVNQISFNETGRSIDDVTALEFYTKIESLTANAGDHIFLGAYNNGQLVSGACLEDAVDFLGMLHSAKYALHYSNSNYWPLYQSKYVRNSYRLDNIGEWQYRATDSFNIYMGGASRYDGAYYSARGFLQMHFPTGDMLIDINSQREGYNQSEVMARNSGVYGISYYEDNNAQVVIKTGPRLQSCGF